MAKKGFRFAHMSLSPSHFPLMHQSQFERAACYFAPRGAFIEDVCARFAYAIFTMFPLHNPHFKKRQRYADEYNVRFRNLAIDTRTS
jgi:hypothetical protein